MTMGRSLLVDQLNSTSLKWGQDGELSRLDQQRILMLLCQADPVACSLIDSLDDPRAVGRGSSGSNDLARVG